MTTNPSSNPNNSGTTLHMAIELSSSQWKLAFADFAFQMPTKKTQGNCLGNFMNSK